MCFDISSSDRRVLLRALSDSPLCGNYPRPFSSLDCDFARSGNLPRHNFPRDLARFSRNAGHFGPTFLRIFIWPYRHKSNLFLNRRTIKVVCVFNDKSHPLILKGRISPSVFKCFSSEEFWMKRYCSIFNLRLSHTTEISFSVARKIKSTWERPSKITINGSKLLSFRNFFDVSVSARF